jgi:hypothetical protein
MIVYSLSNIPENDTIFSKTIMSGLPWWSWHGTNQKSEVNIMYCNLQITCVYDLLNKWECAIIYLMLDTSELAFILDDVVHVQNDSLVFSE